MRHSQQQGQGLSDEQFAHVTQDALRAARGRPEDLNDSEHRTRDLIGRMVAEARRRLS